VAPSIWACAMRSSTGWSARARSRAMRSSWFTTCTSSQTCPEIRPQSSSRRACRPVSQRTALAM
jgi:hypothetical protein